jgi:hypothetical protein
MKLLIGVISTTLLISSFMGLVAIDNRASKPHNSSTICNTKYKTVDNHRLFQLTRRLHLNCDSTFTFKVNSCINWDTSFGTWSIKNGIVCLYSSERIKKLQRKLIFQRNGQTLVDLTNSTIFIKDSIAILTATEKWLEQNRSWTDTLKAY